ncbi:hypothetical protein R6Z07F_018319 [Ovis aries]
MKKSGAELGQQAQATAAAAGALAGAAAARGALRGMRQSPGGRSARGGPGAPAGARGPALWLPHPARPAPCAARGPRRTPEERGRRFPGGGEAYPGRRLPKKRPPRSGSRVSGSPASAAYMEDPRRQKTKGRGGHRRPLPGLRLAAGAPRKRLLAPTRLRRLEAPVVPHAAFSERLSSSRPGASLSPRPPSPGTRVLLPPPGVRRAALRGSWAGRSAARRRRAGSRLGQLSPARRADRARRPAGSAGAARGQAPPCAEQASECARGSPPPARPPAPAPFPPPSSPFPPPPPSRRRLLPAPPPPPPGPLLCWFHCAVARPAPASSRGRLDTLSL